MFNPTDYFAVMSILIGFVCLVLAGFLLIVPSKRQSPNRFLAVFLLLTAIELSGWLWVDSANYNSWSNALRQALGKLQMPVFLGIFIASCYMNFRLRWRDMLHLLPMLGALIISLPGSQIPFVSNGAVDRNLTDAEQDALQIGSHLLYYGYMIAVGWVLLRFRRLYQQQYAAGRSETLQWLTQLALASFCAHTLVLVRDGLQLTPAYQIVLPLQMASALIALGILTWIAFKSLLQPDLFRSVDPRLLHLTQPTKLDHEISIDELKAFMAVQQPYLNPDLSLTSLSNEIALTPREVSELINRSTGMHFFDFVNLSRVEHAKTLLTSDDNLTVLQAAYDSGFNSKSSFNTAFKKHTGMTPSAYRASQATNLAT